MGVSCPCSATILGSLFLVLLLKMPGWEICGILAVILNQYTQGVLTSHADIQLMNQVPGLLIPISFVLVNFGSVTNLSGFRCNVLSFGLYLHHPNTSTIDVYYMPVGH